jgi:hypothetical protein
MIPNAEEIKAWEELAPADTDIGRALRAMAKQIREYDGHRAAWRRRYWALEAHVERGDLEGAQEFVRDVLADT